MQETDELVFDNAAYSAPIPEHLTDKEIIAALNKLPEHYRAVVMLADVHEFDYKEVAQILDIPIGTVMSRLSRARNNSKNRWQKSPSNTGIKKSETFAPVYT